ncbi:phage DNA-binding protein [Caballeronia calidae]|uniref:Phage DNA-binding protein n=1 Tax=Caballeronia calidae TaxID=1777139 RepID=A0A158A8D9_9BURK|nr:hypothetical protein [Caballeronia calidae]SAK53367.1 phage DNA-binding protein [Caballeronia calidae]
METNTWESADAEVPSSIIVERLLYVCADKRRKHDFAEVMGWSVDMVDKVRQGTTGVPVNKLATFMAALELVTFTIGYADYLARGNVIGSNCHCARMNMGECGRR